MHLLVANTLNELEKLRLMRKTQVFLTLSVLFILGAGALVAFGESRLGLYAVSSASFPLVLLGLFAGILLPLFIFSTAAELFAGELGDKTLKLTLTRPITRFKIYLAKILAIGLLLAVLLGLLGLTSVLVSSVLGGGFALAQVVVAYGVTLVPMFFLTIVAAFVAQFFASSGSALTTLVLLYLAAKLMPFFAPLLGRISPFAYTDWYKLWLASQVDLGQVLNIFVMLLGSSLIVGAAGYYWFESRNL